MNSLCSVIKKCFFPITTIFLTIGMVSLCVLGVSDGWVKRGFKNIIIDIKGEESSYPFYYASSDVSDTDICIVAGVLRNTGDGWKLIEDKSHSSLNCNSVYIIDSAEFVTVDYSGIDAKSVISFVVTPDETFTEQGYSCGASVGLEYSNIYFYKNSNGINENFDANKLVSETGNFWFIGVFEV